MFSTFFMFGVVAALFELYIVWHMKPLYNFITGSSFGEILGVGFSIGLSILLASLFGAAGLIVMAGSIISTIITMIVYKLKIIPVIFEFIESIKKFILSIKRIYFSIRHPWHSYKGRNPYVTI